MTGGTHALAQAVASQELTGRTGRVLAAAIGVEEGVLADQASAERVLQGAAVTISA